MVLKKNGQRSASSSASYVFQGQNGRIAEKHAFKRIMITVPSPSQAVFAKSAHNLAPRSIHSVWKNALCAGNFFYVRTSTSRSTRFLGFGGSSGTTRPNYGRVLCPSHLRQLQPGCTRGICVSVMSLRNNFRKLRGAPKLLAVTSRIAGAIGCPQGGAQNV
jgi:hypothetical protein